MSEAQEAFDRGDILEMPVGETTPPVAEANPVTGEQPAETPPATATATATAETTPVEDGTPAPAAETKVEPEAKAEPEVKAEVRVPKSRLDEALRQSRELQDRLNALEKQHAEKSSASAEDINTKLDELEAKYVTALTEGDHEGARALRRESRELERQLFQAETQHSSSVIPSQVAMQQVVESTIAQIEVAYPEFNPDDPLFDAAASQEVVDLIDTFNASGKYSPAEAIAKAARFVASERSFADRSAPAAAPPTNHAAARVEAAVSKAVEASNSQPPAVKAGVASNALGGPLTAEVVAKMSNKEFDALDEKTKASLRGDTI